MDKQIILEQIEAHRIEFEKSMPETAGKSAREIFNLCFYADSVYDEEWNEKVKIKPYRFVYPNFPLKFKQFLERVGERNKKA